MNTSVNEHTYHLRGLSTDEKPILEKLSNGSSFLEIDTGKFYIFRRRRHQHFRRQDFHRFCSSRIEG